MREKRTKAAIQRDLQIPVQLLVQIAMQKVVQKPVQMIVQKKAPMQIVVQSSVQSSCRCFLQKNGSDADQFAEEMQKAEQEMYEFSTNPDTRNMDTTDWRGMSLRQKKSSLSILIRLIRGLFSVCRKMAQM